MEKFENSEEMGSVKVGLSYSSIPKRIDSLIPPKEEEFNGQKHFDASTLETINTRREQPSQLLPLVFDTVQGKICEIQPLSTSVTPNKVKKRYITILNKLSDGDNNVFVTHNGERLKHHELFEEVETVQSKWFSDLDKMSEDDLSKAIVLFGAKNLKILVSKHKTKLKYYDTLAVEGVHISLLFMSKVLQRIVISMIARELNPACWHLFHSDTPPSLTKINQLFPEGYIIKPDNSSRGEGITTQSFQTENEFRNQ